ncbi:hypothetical protein ABVT39_017241, partial [Epinephelus coioides]
HTPFFSVASDASNHGTTKLFPLSLRYWTAELSLQTKILDFYEDSDESAATIHHQITNRLKENGLRLEMISAHTADNASVNYGTNNSVFQKLKGDNGDILKANRMAHIVYNSAKHAGDKLNIDIECVVNKTLSHRRVRSSCLDKWSTLLKHTHTPYLTAVASFLFNIPITNASVERVFSRMTECWTDQRNCCSVELMKSEIQVKSNLRFKEFYAYALKEKALLEAARSDKKYKVRKNL